MAKAHYCPDAEAVVSDELYFVEHPHGLIKIGRSHSAKDRFANIQTSNPYPIRLLAAVPGKGWQEPVWHFAFGWLREHGEWFHAHPSLKDAMNAAVRGEEWIAVLTPPPQIFLRGKRDIIQACMAELGASMLDAAAYVWRDTVADVEEALESKLHLVAHLTGSHPHV